MKLVSLNDYPQWKSVFCQLSNRVVPEKERSLVLKPEYVDKILGLNFPVTKEAFFFEDPTGEFFGRIFLHRSLTNQEVGHWGLFCLSPEPKHREGFIKLWPQIENWFRKHGINKIIGPFVYSTVFPYRMRWDTCEESFSWEPSQAHIDREVFKELNFQVDQTYFSNFIENYGSFATQGMQDYEDALRMGYKMREMRSEDFEEDLKIIFELSMKAFSDNYLFSPVPYEVFKQIYYPAFQGLDLKLSCIQENASGEPVGYLFTFILDNQVVIKTVSVLPSHRGKGLFNAAIRWSMLKAMELYPEVKKVVPALIHEINAPVKHVANGSEKIHRHEYVLLKKELS